MSSTPPVVTFDYTAFIASFPSFAACSQPQLQTFFDIAGRICRNDACNPAYQVGYPAPPGILPMLLNLATAHLAQLMAPRDPLGNPAAIGLPAPAIVGRIASAGEGSVNVSTEWAAQVTDSEAFWIQTQFGATYWTATAQFRLFRYSPRPTVVALGPYGYGGRGRGFR